MMERGGIPEEGAVIVGATLSALKRAAHGVEIERRLGEALQLSLLPELPVVPGLRFAARYRAGTADTRVGGDWYDAFPLRAGKVGIVIGDVVGQGVEAAARMAHLQSALRAYALEGLRPAVVLERMNGFVLEGEQGGMVTVLYAIVDPDGSTVKLASAGHPPPLIHSPGGTPVFAEARAGTPLGVTYFPTYEESMATLDPWSTLLLYTDGLAEGPELPLADGLEALRLSVADGPAEPEELCRTLLGSLDTRAGSRDDLALLAVQVTPPERTLVISVPTRPSSVACMRRAMSRWLRSAGADDVEIYEILLACGEACVNTIAHAHPAVSDAPFEVHATREGDEIVIVVSDGGKWRRPPRAGRGRGVALMRELMDAVRIDPGDRGTRVTMRRRLEHASGT